MFTCLINVRHLSHNSRNVHSIPIFSVKYIFYKNSFFPFIISEWTKLDPVIRNFKSSSTFRKYILHFIAAAIDSIYNSHNRKDLNV